MTITPIRITEDKETQLILVSDLLSRTCQKPMTAGNLERVSNLARKIVELTATPTQ